jgi:hypothetical protein
VKVDVHEQHWSKEQNGKRQEYDTKQRVLNSPWISVAFRHTSIGVVFVRFNRFLEDCLRQEVQQSTAEQPQNNPRHHVSPAKIHIGPHEIHDEVDDDAQVRELERQPHVRPACQDLKLVTQPFDEVEEAQVEVRHLSEVY